MLRWYRNAVIYEIDPALFRDANGDGWGDLRGITERLGYLRDLGVDCLWLLPFYVSPFRDCGYDITDHLGVAERFGTLADAEALIAAAERHGMRVLLDLVVQHTSIDHPWFQAACGDRHSRYHDYYIWADRPEPTDVEPIFPTVEDSVWAWNDRAGRYYRHIFYANEPDLNIGNPEVVDEILRIMTFWLERGAAGFRVDAASHLVESARSSDPRHNGFAILEQLRAHARRLRSDAALLGEADVVPQAYPDFFGNDDRLNLVSSFWLNNHLFLSLARRSARPLVEALRQQPQPGPNGQYSIWMRNHDELDLDRLSDAGREEVMRQFAPERSMHIYGRGIRRRLPPMLDGDRRRIAMALAIVMSLPGTPVIRYGEEIGMGDDLALPEREAVRTAMQWSDGPDAGFSANAGERLRVPLIRSGRYGFAEVNVAAQAGRDDSLLEQMRRMVKARRMLPAVGAGSCRTLETDAHSLLALLHELPGEDSVLALVNLAPEEVGFRLPQVPGRAEPVLADGEYPPDEAGRVRLHPYGYRWFRLSGA